MSYKLGVRSYELGCGSVCGHPSLTIKGISKNSVVLLQMEKGRDEAK